MEMGTDVVLTDGNGNENMRSKMNNNTNHVNDRIHIYT